MATEFQQKVWDAVEAIPFGKVTTYGAIARAAGKPNAARYISRIIGQHPNTQILPWHRIVYSNGAVWLNPTYEQARKKLYKKEGIVLVGEKIQNFRDILFEF